MTKDWTGNKKSVYTCLGASNHVEEEREINDFYATAPEACEWLLKLEPDLSDVYEPAVGQGHLAEVLRKANRLRAVSDLVDRGYYPEGIMKKYPLDFFSLNKIWNGDIVSNPPYSQACHFIKHALDIIPKGRKVCMFLKVQFLEGKERKEFFEDTPPLRVWVSSSRIPCAKNGEFYIPKKNKDGSTAFNHKGEPVLMKVSAAVAYAWFVWEKGYKGDTVLKWFN